VPPCRRRLNVRGCMFERLVGTSAGGYSDTTLQNRQVLALVFVDALHLATSNIESGSMATPVRSRAKHGETRACLQRFDLAPQRMRKLGIVHERLDLAQPLQVREPAPRQSLR